jgi:hypothetical protein
MDDVVAGNYLKSRGIEWPREGLYKYLKKPLFRINRWFNRRIEFKIPP